MKRGTPRHFKTRALARTLKIPTPHAAGILVFLWDFAADFCPDGGVGRLSDEEIAEACGWPERKAKDLISALLEKGWLDTNSECRLYIHDWHDHCEDTVQRKLARALKLFANGATPKLNSLEKKERDRIEQVYMSRGHGVPTESPLRAHAEGTESPPPLPIPLPMPGPVPMPMPKAPVTWRSFDEMTFKNLLRSESGFTEFKAVAQSAGMTGSDLDWEWSGNAWDALDFEQRLDAIKGIRDRAALGIDDGVMKSLPQNYLRGHKWQRAIRVDKPKATAADEGRRVFEEMKARREAAGGKS